MTDTRRLLEMLPDRKFLIVIGLVATAAGGLLSLGGHSDATPTPAQSHRAAALTVTAAAATRAQWPTALEISGAIAPWQEAIIAAQVSGLRLAEIRVNVGDRVRRGQVLAVYYSDLLRADEARLRASWQQAQANRQRALELRGSGGISEQDILKYVTDADIAKAQLESTQLQIRYAIVRAPDDGVISSRTATVGSVSGSGQELFRMIRQSRLEWRGELTAEQLTGVKAGQNIDLALPDGTNAHAHVRQMAPSLDSQTRLGLVYADIAPGSTAHAGMYVKGNIALSQRPAIIVPAASVVIRDGRSYVLKFAGSEQVRLQPVTVGRRQGDATEIVAGIVPGDKVAVQGAGFLNDGDVVRLANDAPAAAGRTKP